MPTELLLDGFICKKHCKKFHNCRALCAPVKFMVKKVEYEPPKEIPLKEGMPEVAKWPELGQCTGELALKKYFLSRESPQEIAKTLQVSKSYVYRVIRDGKKIISQNMQKKVHSPP